MQPAISFAHQKGGGGGGEQPGARARARREKRERAKEREREKHKSSFSPIWSIELRTSDSILPTLTAGKLRCGTLKTDYEMEMKKE